MVEIDHIQYILPLVVFPVPLHEIPHDPRAANVRRVLPAKRVPVAVEAAAVGDLGPAPARRPYTALPPVDAIHRRRVGLPRAAA